MRRVWSASPSGRALHALRARFTLAPARLKNAKKITPALQDTQN